MTFLKFRIYSPGVAATVAMHAAFGLALLQFDSAQSSAAAAPVMVSLIDSAGQEHVTVPPRSVIKPRAAPEMPPPAPTAKAPALESPVVLPPSDSTVKASEPAPADSRSADDTAALESSITLPRFSADYLNNPPPVYPALARRLGEQGRVMLRVLVRADGTPAEVEINRSSGSARLDRAALEAVRKWRFLPAQQGDAPVAASVLVPVSFTLEG